MKSGFVWCVTFLPQIQDIEGKAPNEPQTLNVIADSGKEAIAQVEALAAKHKPGADFQLCGLGLVRVPQQPSGAPLIVWVLDDGPVTTATTEEGMAMRPGEVLEADHGPGRFGIPVSYPAPIPIETGKK